MSTLRAKTKMRCDGYPRAMFVHQVFEAEREVSLGFKKGKGGYFEQADFEDVLGEWGADEPAGRGGRVTRPRPRDEERRRGPHAGAARRRGLLARLPEPALVGRRRDDGVARRRGRRAGHAVRHCARGAAPRRAWPVLERRSATAPVRARPRCHLRSEKRGPRRADRRNGVGLKAAAATLGGGAVG